MGGGELGEDVLKEDPAARGQYVASKTPPKAFYLSILSNFFFKERT